MKLKISGGDIKAVQGDTGHAQANMVTDVYSHIMNDDRKRLALTLEQTLFPGNRAPLLISNVSFLLLNYKMICLSFFFTT